MKYEFKGTPGPWRWELNRKYKNVQLCGGVPKFDLIVMDFVRYGMNGANPRFRTSDDGVNIMEPAEKFSVSVAGREHHYDWFASIDHADAHFISAAPDLITACINFINKVDEGHAKSTESYGEMKAAVCKALNIEL